MVAAIRLEDDARRGVIAHAVEELAEALDVVRRRSALPVVAAVVLAGEVKAAHTCAIRGLPPKIGLDPMRIVVAVAESTPDDGVLDFEAGEDLRHLADVAELIGQIADRDVVDAKRGRHLFAEPEVADRRLAAGQERVREHIPGTDQHATGADEIDKSAEVLRPHLEVIAKHDVLSVEHKAGERGVGLQRLDQSVDCLDELESEVLEGRPPLPIPVSVVVDDDAGLYRRRCRLGAFHPRLAHASARSTRSPTPTPAQTLRTGAESFGVRGSPELAMWVA